MNDRSGRKLDYETYELTPKHLQVLFVEWLCGDRGPSETQADFAARHDIHPGTLSKWKKDDQFVKLWERRMRQLHADPDKQHRLLERLFDKALTSGDAKDVETYFKLIDRMSPNRIEVDSKRSLAELSDSELAAMAAEFAEASEV